MVNEEGDEVYKTEKVMRIFYKPIYLSRVKKGVNILLDTDPMNTALFQRCLGKRKRKGIILVR